MVCRQKEDGAIEIAAGHHRVQAAIEVGIKECDVQVAPASKRDDVAMIRIYARENATQRGNSATARIGSVAAAVRVCAKEFFFDAGESSSVREPSIFVAHPSRRKLRTGRRFHLSPPRQTPRIP